MAMTDFDFMLTEEQIELRNLFRDFAQKEVKEPCRESEKLGECPEYLVKKAIDMGVPMMTLPEEYGGLGLDYLTCAIIREELARGDVGFASRVTGFGFTPFRLAGTEEQRHMAAEAMTAGGVIAFALTESGAGSNAVDMATTARKDGDGYIINGGKTFITNGDCADIVVTFAVTDKSKGSKGITAFMIPKGTPGFDAGHHEDKMGFRNVHTCSLFFDDMRLPDKYRLGEEGGLGAGRAGRGRGLLQAACGRRPAHLQEGRDRRHAGRHGDAGPVRPSDGLGGLPRGQRRHL